MNGSIHYLKGKTMTDDNPYLLRLNCNAKIGDGQDYMKIQYLESDGEFQFTIFDKSDVNRQFMLKPEDVEKISPFFKQAKMLHLLLEG